MTKRALLNKFNELLQEKGMSKVQLLYGCIGVNSTKNEIQSGINCLSASYEEMNNRLEQFKNMYPAI